MRVGVVTIGRNEGARLIRCLASIGRDVPVVYVDSASTDGSQARADAAGAIVHSLDLSQPFTASRARREGATLLLERHPDTAFIKFVDGDCEVEAGWMQVAHDQLVARPELAAVCGRRRERYPEVSLYNAMADYEWDAPAGESESCGGDAMFRVDAYLQAGGFDPRMIACEEPELCARIRAHGWRILRVDAPMTIHDAATYRFGQWWRRGVRSGMGRAQAWWLTRRGRGERMYDRELIRVIAWALLLPLACIAAALLIHPWLLLAWPSVLLVQVVRWSGPVGLRHAILAPIAHFAELSGVARFAWRALRGSAGGTLFYK